MKKFINYLWFVVCVTISAVFIGNGDLHIYDAVGSVIVFVCGRILISKYFTSHRREKNQLEYDSRPREISHWVSGPNYNSNYSQMAFVCIKNLTVAKQISSALRNLGCYVIQCDSFSALDTLLSHSGEKANVFIDSAALAENIFLISDVEDLKNAGVDCKFYAVLSDAEIANLDNKIFFTFDAVFNLPLNSDEALSALENLFQNNTLRQPNDRENKKFHGRITSPIPKTYRKVLTTED